MHTARPELSYLGEGSLCRNPGTRPGGGWQRRQRATLVARVATPLLYTFVLPEAVDLSVRGRVFGFTFVVGVGSGLLVGLAPVFQALRPNTTAALRDRGTVASDGRGAWMRGAFVILQVAVSLVLLVGAGLFIRTLENAYSVELGYQVDQTLVASQSRGARRL